MPRFLIRRGQSCCTQQLHSHKNRLSNFPTLNRSSSKLGPSWWYSPVISPCSCRLHAPTQIPGSLCPLCYLETSTHPAQELSALCPLPVDLNNMHASCEYISQQNHGYEYRWFSSCLATFFFKAPHYFVQKNVGLIKRAVQPAKSAALSDWGLREHLKLVECRQNVIVIHQKSLAPRLCVSTAVFIESTS